MRAMEQILCYRPIPTGLAKLPVPDWRSHTTYQSAVGTRKAIPVNLPFKAGITLPTALAAPVEEGIMFPKIERPPRQSFEDGASTVF